MAGIVLLVTWAIGTLWFGAPGWMNLLLTAGVAILIWRIVERGTKRADSIKSKSR